MRAGLAIWIAVALCAQTTADPTVVALHARDKLLDRARHLPDYTCVQTVTRKYYNGPGDTSELKRNPCGQVIAEGDKRNYQAGLWKTDRIRFDVKVSGSTEISSWVGAPGFASRSILLDLARKSYQSGVLGPLLEDIFFMKAPNFVTAARTSRPARASSRTLFTLTRRTVITL